LTKPPPLPGPEAIRAFLDDAHVAQAASFASFVERRWSDAEPPADDDAARREARALVGELAKAGAYDAIRDEDLRRCCLQRELLAAASPLADAVFALQALGTLPILLGRSDQARERFAKPALAGKAMAAFARTEAGAGSDVASMTTSAHRDGDDWILDGTKLFISNAGIADFYVVFATSLPGRGAKGITAFVVPADAAGFRFVRAQVMSAPHPLGEIAFDKCRIGDDCRLSVEGEGFRLGLGTLDRLRATVAAAACGMAHRALQEAMRHATTRRQFAQPLSEFQLVQDKLARMATDLDAARLLAYRAAWKKDGGAERVTVESAMAKAFATEAAQRIVDDAVQILGGRGVLADHPVDHLYRSVRALRIYEGTTEIQHLLIAGALLRELRG
jgi:acyl-CoA dehydrogenase